MAKLMLVEDDNNLREIYEARLQAEGYDIVTARDGEEALVVAKAQNPDLIISDVMMPKISGFEMLDILRNTEGLKDVKVIMLTALGQNDDQQRADRLGADRYLVKSQVTLEDIVKAAHDLLEDTPAAAPAADATPTPAPVAPAPVPAPEPIPVAEPVAAAPTTASDTAATPPIETFVAGATDIPTATPTMPVAPAPEPMPAPVIPAPVQAIPVAEPPTEDTVVKDAAQRLEDSTVSPDAADDQASGSPAATSPQFPPAPTAVQPTPASTPTPAPASSSATTVAHDRVITPPTGPPKKDINQLLAEEEARAAAGTPPAPSQIITSNDNDKIDPQSIAL